MQTTRSADGTPIAFDRRGDGPPIVLVTGALGSRTFDPLLTPLAEQLASRFTTVVYDRRGRGESGDTPPYAVEREVDDLAALITEVGGRAGLYGISSGAMLALAAADQLEGITALALYEPPFIVDGGRPALPAGYVDHLDTLVAEDRRSEAVEYFMTTAVGIPAAYLQPMKADPSWAGMTAVAHTLPYDGRIAADLMAGRPLPHDRWSGVTAPTLVVTGGESAPFFHTGAGALVEVLAHARHEVLDGQDHAVDPGALAPLLTRFFADTEVRSS